MKLHGYELWEKIGKPKYVVAPMVDQSELPFRMLCNKYGAQLSYTPMIHSRLFIQDPTYRKDVFTTCKDDKNLVIQICGNDPDIVLEAANAAIFLTEKYSGSRDNIVSIDLNLGCPQQIAKRGFYGSFLMDDMPRIRSIVSTLHQHCDIPVSCKIRVFDDIQQTLAYAKMLEEAGCAMLTVHGRTREQRGHKMGLADWEKIRLVKEHIKTIPVIANGNIQKFEDIERCLEYTKCDAVMSAETLLQNPALFSNQDYMDRIELAREYLELCQQYPGAAMGMIRGHLFELLDAYLGPEENDLRIKMSSIGNRHKIEAFTEILDTLRRKYPTDYLEKLAASKTEEVIQQTEAQETIPEWF